MKQNRATNKPTYISIFFFLLMSLCFQLGWTQQDRLYFNHINQRLGLSQTTNKFIFKDSRGFIWISSQNGLNRYDGQRIKVYKHNPNDTTSLLGSYIQSNIIEDSKGDLWFSTDEGLVRYVRKDDNFRCITKTDDSTSLQNCYLSFADKQGKLGVVADGNKIYLYSPETSKWKLLQKVIPKGRYRVVPIFNSDGKLDKLFAYGIDEDGLYIYSNISTIQSSSQIARFIGERRDSALMILDILPEKDSILWVATNEGLLKFAVNNSRYQLYPGEGMPNSLAFYGENKLLMSFFKSKIFKGGLKLVDKDAPGVVVGHYYHGPNCHWNLASDKAQGVWVDDDGVIWTGVNGVGVDFTLPPKVKFGFKDVREIWKGKEDVTPDVFALAEDSSGNLWYSNRSSGVFKVEYPSFRPLERFAEDDNNLISNDIHYLLVDSKDRCWAFTYYGGLGLYEPGSSVFRSTLRGKVFVHGIELKDGRLIFSLMSGGLCELSTEGDSVKMDMISSISRDYGYSRLFQNRDSLVFGARVASNSDPAYIDIMNPNNGFEVEDSFPIKGVILSFYEDTLVNAIWIGTSNGLVCLDYDNRQWETYDEDDGLPDQQVYAVLGDANGSLWLSTNRGLVQYFLEEHRFHAFDVPDGLQGLEFNRNSYLARANGELIFGGQNGINFFHPDSINFVLTPPKVQFTKLEIEDGKVPVPPCEITGATNISEVQRLKLEYNQNTLNFEFAALEFSNPEKNTFKYIMEGVDRDTVDGGTKGSARYPNLRPGSYTFWVKAANSDGKWSAPKKMEIIINAPWYGTWWAYALYGLAIMSLLYALYRFQLNRQLAAAEVRRLNELDTIKTKFYTNITHEFRTPLTVILGMAQQIRDNSDNWLAQGLEMIERNGKILLNLVNQMLDLRKLESGTLRTHLERGDILNYLKYIIESFSSYAISKNIRIHIFTELQELPMDYDQEKVLTIISNLLSNAIKFTPEGGDVYINLDKISENLELEALSIKISDTGIGIPPEKLPHIFDRFYQVDDETTRQSEGTGIGLTLVNELVKLLKGKISVESVPGKGTAFILILPITHTAKPVGPIDEPAIKEKIKSFILAIFKKDHESTTAKGSKKLPLVLIVEDNKDVVIYLKNCLEKNYHLAVAYNGQQGIDKALEIVPDLIICDVMMPQKDGFEVCKTLKNDERSSHIPIIMLTAKADIQSKLEGLERGADAYLPKPPNEEELMIRIKNLLELRQKLKQHYLSLAGLAPGDKLLAETAAIEKAEHAFVKKVRAIVKEHLDDSEFKVEHLCREVGMSNAQLYRKLIALTGYSAKKFMLHIRFRKAKSLLLETDETIASVAFTTGFNDPDNFGRAFKKEFGQTPTEFRGRLKGDG